MAKSLGKLKRFNLQEFWGEEFDKFSTWLIQPEILEMVGDAIGLELKPPAEDIYMELLQGGVVARNVRRDTYVVIQGQLAGITYSDFGRLVTAAAEVDAETVVWIASSIPVDHRKTLEWLNEISRDHIQFFGAELELWRIDDSAPAPNFSLVSQPHSLTRNPPFGLDTENPMTQREKEPESPLPKKEPVAERKGDWTKKGTANALQTKSSSQTKEDVSVRENFVYTKSF